MRRKFISLFLTASLLFQQTGFIYALGELDISNYLNRLSGAVTQDKFRPLHMRYFSYDAQNNDFNLLLDKGDEKELKDKELKDKTDKLLEYFKIGLALPNDKFWVNLRPDAEDQIIDPDLEKTDIGKILLEADLQLKKDTAGATSPQTAEGKQYWDKLYKKAGELFGTENITIPTITRPWIVPGEVIINTSTNAAYIYKANLKVMLEEDYLSRGRSRTAPTLDGSRSAPTSAFQDPRLKELNQYSTQLIRELIIPRLTKEINTAKRYSALRQVFYSLVLAKWFKKTFVGKSGEYSSLIDTNNLTGLISPKSWSKLSYFNEYKKSFQDGEYNLKEPVYTPAGQTLRSYVSGGASPMVGEPTEIPVKNMEALRHSDMINIPASAIVPLEIHKKLKILQAENLLSRSKALAFVKNREEAQKIDPELTKVVFEKGNNRIEWAAMVDWILNTEEGQAALENTLKLGREIRKKYKYVFACGIGGSGEGVEVIRRNFSAGSQTKLYPLMTPDADAVNSLVKSIADSEGISIEEVLKNSAAFFITKSGSTPETTSHFNYFKELYERTALNLKERIWIMTDPNSKMAVQEYKEKYNWMTIQLNAGTGIGGRFTSPATNIPLLFLAIFNDGIVKEMLEEAERMNNVPAEEDMFLRLAAFIDHYTTQAKNSNVTLFIPEEFKVWFLQLFEESLGKELKGVTFFPAGDKLTPENLRPDDIFVRITIGGEKARQDLWEHLQSKNYPAFELNIKDKKGIFGLQMGLARAVIALAYLWKICAVDQDAVEGYKKGGNLIRDELKKGRTVEDILKEKNWTPVKTGNINFYYGQLLKAGLITKTELYNKAGMLPESVFRDAPASAWYAAALKALEEKGRLNSAEIAYYCQPNDEIKKMVEASKEDIFTQTLKIRARVSQGTARNHATHQNAKAGQEIALTVILPLKFKPNQDPNLPYYSPDLMPALGIATVADLSEDAKRPSMLITTDIGINQARGELEDFFREVSFCLRLMAASSAVTNKSEQELKSLIQESQSKIKAAIMDLKVNNTISAEDLKEARIVDGMPLSITLSDGEKITIDNHKLNIIKEKVLPAVLKEYDLRGPDYNLLEELAREDSDFSRDLARLLDEERKKDAKKYDGNKAKSWNKEALVLLGIALAQTGFESHHGLERLNPGDVFIMAGDNGPSTPVIRHYLAEGLRLAGIMVIDLGLCSSGELYTSIERFGAQGGLYVTRSHVELGTNGFKPKIGKTTLFAEMITRLGQTIKDNKFNLLPKGVITDQAKVDTIKRSTRQLYLAHIALEFGWRLKELLQKFPDSKLAVDCGNGSSTEYVDFLKEMLGDNLVKVFRDKPDPFCKSGLADASRSDEVALGHPKSAGDKSIVQWSKDNSDVLIFNFDLDMDRCSIMKDGILYKGEKVFYPLVEYGLSVENNKIRQDEYLSDLRMSPAFGELVRHFEGKVVSYPKGHSKIKADVEKTLSVLAKENHVSSIKEFINMSGYKNRQAEFSLHMFYVNEEGACIDDALHFMFEWLTAFGAVIEHKKGDFNYSGYIASLEKEGVISKWYTVEEQRTPMQDEYKKKFMNDLRDYIRNKFQDRNDFEYLSYNDLRKLGGAMEKKFTLVDVDGVYGFFTPLGIFYWGWSNTSEKIAFGAHSRDKADIKKLVEIMMACFYELRDKLPNLRDDSKKIGDGETLDYLNIMGAKTNPEAQKLVSEKYHSSEEAIKELIAASSAIAQAKDFKGGGIDIKGDSWIQVAGMNSIREFSDVLARNINREMDIDKEFIEIKNLIQGGNIPSPERLGEDIGYCLYKDRFGAYRDDIELSLMGVGRLKEEYGLDMGKEYLQILFLTHSIVNPFESENYVSED